MKGWKISSYEENWKNFHPNCFVKNKNIKNTENDLKSKFKKHEKCDFRWYNNILYLYVAVNSDNKSEKIIVLLCAVNLRLKLWKMAKCMLNGLRDEFMKIKMHTP